MAEFFFGRRGWGEGYKVGHNIIYYCLMQCFSTGVPRNPRVPQEVARGSARNSNK